MFVNFDGKAAPVAEQYQDLARMLAPWKTEDMEVVITLDWECEFNWKVMIENWMESLPSHRRAQRDAQQDHAGTEHMDRARTSAFRPRPPAVQGAHQEEMEEALGKGEALPGFTAIPGLSIEDQVEWGL